MKILNVTMTGADDSVTPADLFKISKTYPFVEWGILVSRNSQGKNRFPSLEWMDKLAKENMALERINLSCHLCGAYVKEFLMGSDRFVKEIGPLWAHFKRVQINTHGVAHQFDKKGLIEILNKYHDKEFIFQYDNVNTKLLAPAGESKAHIATLFDLSHGTGVSPLKWPTPIQGVKCGYAGGLSPENVAAQLTNINYANRSGVNDIWIDMETHVRSDNDLRFDLDKVEQVLKTCLDSGFMHEYGTEKITTFTVDWGDGDLIVANINEAMVYAGAANFNPADHDDGILEFTVKVEKKYTRQECDNLKEFDI